MVTEELENHLSKGSLGLEISNAPLYSTLLDLPLPLLRLMSVQAHQTTTSDSSNRVLIQINRDGGCGIDKTALARFRAPSEQEQNTGCLEVAG